MAHETYPGSGIYVGGFIYRPPTGEERKKQEKREALINTLNTLNTEFYNIDKERRKRHPQLRNCLLASSLEDLQ